ncbi:MAG: trypsin-like peptidase domain-containing protein [Clostridia bacterium]|nr:trypsin-like peptidase domain-containing protein [Clostridia bacterium]
MKKKMAALLTTVFCASSVFAFTGCLDLGMFGDGADYEKWSENIVTTALRSNVTVEKRTTSFQALASEAQGSGVIFYQDVQSYYALTNYHVAYKDASLGTISVKYTVTDCFDESDYTNVKFVYGDAAYDLAVISFDRKVGVSLAVTPIAESNPKSLEPVAAIGQPKGLHNGVTFGKTVGYESVEITDTDVQYSNVQFPALVHNCYTQDGSSGGGIINESLQLVGIHYACGFDLDGGYVEGYAIPAEKIRAFLADAEMAKSIELGV